MEGLKVTVFVLVLSGFYHGRAMGRCRFGRKNPCENKEGSRCFKKQDQVTTSNPTNNLGPTSHTTTIQRSTTYSTTNQSTTHHSSTDQVTNEYSTIDSVITTSPLCPRNMLYLNCNTCQGTCLDPNVCINNCTESFTCVCGEGYLLKGDECVPEEACGCFLEGEGVVPEGIDYVSPNCSHRCSCVSGKLTCDDNYSCSPNAVCEERNRTLQCYCNAGYRGDGVNCTEIHPLDCKEVYDRVSNESGVYKIKPSTWQGEPLEVYCNMADGGGWTVFQRRFDGSQNFFLTWSHYKDGFGKPDGELWLGNDMLHALTTQKNYELRVDLVDSMGNSYYAEHSSFSISDERGKYRLSLGDYSAGNTDDRLSFNDGQAFTTRDRDNDQLSGGNCARKRINNASCTKGCYNNGAWWYKKKPCSLFHLNSPYNSDCLRFDGNFGVKCRLKSTEMKIRPI